MATDGTVVLRVPTCCRDPTDPTKFFQQQDNTFQDAVALCTLIAVLYFVFTAFTELEKLH